jgi:hypothetical protein
MTQAPTVDAKVKTAKPDAAPFGPPNYGTTKFDLPKMEVPEGLREMAEKSVAQAKDTFEMVKAAAENTTELLKDSYVTVS